MYVHAANCDIIYLSMVNFICVSNVNRSFEKLLCPLCIFTLVVK